MTSSKIWGGRFEQGVDELAADFSASVEVDQRLALCDIQGSIAHVHMLQSTKIRKDDEAKALLAGLEQIRDEVSAGKLKWDPKLEDIHMNIEALLTSRVGEVGGRLHTARSRNDQVATDMRLWTRQATVDLINDLDQLLTVLYERAEQHQDTLLPGYTHLQRAQPTRLAHHLLAWSEKFERDRSRFIDANSRLNECPLGAGALSTTTFPIDRHQTAKELAFERPMSNSLDAVSDRDFLAEFLFAISLCAVHLSRLCEELVLWSSQEFAFVDLGDAFTTGSSMMPQKKNPDMAELVRGKTGRAVGNLVNLLVTLKGLPLTYNRDMQEDKAPAFEAFDSLHSSLRVMAAMLDAATFHSETMKAALRTGYLDATEIADYLSTKDVPFREAHSIAGQLVQKAIKLGKTLNELELSDMKNISPLIEQDIYAVLDPETAIERRDVFGGPSKKRVKEALHALQKRLKSRGISI
ncbi:MAG: argininosuccinate lyase [Myxococcales bacterium]|nr:MAG: argininosuccinate lyase [Myxococcales bacterium]